MRALLYSATDDFAQKDQNGDHAENYNEKKPIQINKNDTQNQTDHCPWEQLHAYGIAHDVGSFSVLNNCRVQTAQIRLTVVVPREGIKLMQQVASQFLDHLLGDFEDYVTSPKCDSAVQNIEGQDNTRGGQQISEVTERDCLVKYMTDE